MQLELIPEVDAAYEATGMALAERARRAWRIRMYARQTARSIMQDPLEVELLRKRDAATYGNPDGPTFEGALEKVRSRLRQGQDDYMELIRSAARSSPEATALFEA